jgi:4-hydroxy-3-methylbut-2-enyl diphosphate reductase IspH
MIVVGGTRSANTKELTRLCEIGGTRAVQIESAQGLSDPTLFANIHTVGITGGTSTPIEDLERVALRIAELGGTEQVRANAKDIARAALEAAATPQYRTTSIDGGVPA